MLVISNKFSLRFPQKVACASAITVYNLRQYGSCDWTLSRPEDGNWNASETSVADVDSVLIDSITRSSNLSTVTK